MGEGDDRRLHMKISGDLAALRRRVSQFACAAGLAGRRVDDLVVAVNEAAANVLEHAGGVGVVDALADEDGVRVDVTDPSGGLTNAHLYQLGPRRPPAEGGKGLLVIRRLCDQVTLDHPAGQSRLRLIMHL